MRLGGKITPGMATPEAWVAAVQAKGYRAAYDAATAHVRHVAAQEGVVL